MWLIHSAEKLQPKSCMVLRPLPLIVTIMAYGCRINMVVTREAIQEGLITAAISVGTTIRWDSTNRARNVSSRNLFDLCF
jgi:hypothetical protein